MICDGTSCPVAASTTCIADGGGAEYSTVASTASRRCSGQRVVDDERHARAAGVERLAHRARRARQHAGELIERRELVVPRELIRLRDARAREVVMELMPENARPRFAQPLARIRRRRRATRPRRRALRGVGEQLVLAIEASSSPPATCSSRCRASCRISSPLYTGSAAFSGRVRSFAS